MGLVLWKRPEGASLGHRVATGFELSTDYGRDGIVWTELVPWSRCGRLHFAADGISGNREESEDATVSGTPTRRRNFLR